MNHIMFDFDGTIADTSEGIVNSMHYAYEKLGLHKASDEVIRNMIGPPLEEMFRVLLGTEDEAYIRKAVLFFRERYADKGVKELTLYPGVKETLKQLYSLDKKLYIVTSKPHKFVCEICETYGILPFFEEITGVVTDGKSMSKAARMAILMKEFGITPENGVMVGDRPEDIQAANENLVSSIGMTYGFGKKEELQRCGCKVFADSFSKLTDLCK